VTQLPKDHAQVYTQVLWIIPVEGLISHAVQVINTLDLYPRVMSHAVVLNDVFLWASCVDNWPQKKESLACRYYGVMFRAH
jgi:hypothetical protein